VHATFFVVAQWVDKYPESVKALSDAGNEVMNHSTTHPHMPTLSRDAMLKEITTCDSKIEKITGKRPTLFRAPFGDYNNAVVETVAESNHNCIQWDVDSLDWKGISAPQISQRVLSSVKPGSIILFHNAALHTPEALPGIIESLQKQGYRLVPVSQLIYKDNYTIDVAGKQHSDAAVSNEGSTSIPTA
jgi:peptidoglycan/xylan/chitin deacetylase (PgdA/CDA1 family)